MEEVEAGIAIVLESPDRWPDRGAGVRRYRIRRFPYGLYYRAVNENEVEILAVADLRRLPDYWRDRL